MTDNPYLDTSKYDLVALQQHRREVEKTLGVAGDEEDEDIEGRLDQIDAAIARLEQGEKPLPPDPEGMNDERARWAGAALARFRAQTGCDVEDSLGDLLTDLMHWCDRYGFDFDLALDRAKGHYAEETKREPG